jgi:hypothetical protein
VLLGYYDFNLSIPGLIILAIWKNGTIYWLWSQTQNYRDSTKISSCQRLGEERDEKAEHRFLGESKHYI